MNLSDFTEVSPRTVYLVAYYDPKGEEIIFEQTTKRLNSYLIMNGPVPIKGSKPEQGLKVYKIPDGIDVLDIAKELKGYAAKGYDIN
jgi:hypothetical protein